MEEALILNYRDVDIRREDNLILHNVNLQVHAGEFVFLTGVVGSGKSSLLKSIYAELDIDTGDAEVLGRNLRRLKRRHVPALRKELGIVFQDFRLLPDRNVRENLDFVLRSTGWKKRSERVGRICEVLSVVGLADKLESMPYELSGGEQQRVCIARAILNSPKLILADEATGNQDAESGIRTTRILHELAQQGTAVIMATHNHQLIHLFAGTVYTCKEHRLLPDPPTASSTPADSPLTEEPVPAEQGAPGDTPVDEDDHIPVATIANIND